jgi:hypothetical protein
MHACNGLTLFNVFYFEIRYQPARIHPRVIRILTSLENGLIRLTATTTTANQSERLRTCRGRFVRVVGPPSGWTALEQ